MLFIDLDNGNFILQNYNLLLLSMSRFFFFFYFREGESCTFTVLSVFFKKGYPEKVVLLRITANAIVSGNMGEEEILHLGGCEFFKSI